MAVGTKGLFPEDLDQMTDKELGERLAECKTELFNLRFSNATGQLKAVRRDIARIYTIARERELNIRTAPAEKE